MYNRHQNTINRIRAFRWGFHHGSNLERSVVFVGRQDFLVRIRELLTIWHKPWDGMQLGHGDEAWLDIQWNSQETRSSTSLIIHLNPAVPLAVGVTHSAKC